MKKHRKWETIIAYFREIPIDASLILRIKDLLIQEKNVLILITKEDHEANPKYTPKEKFDALCLIFPEETKNGKIIISQVPDIVSIQQYNL